MDEQKPQPKMTLQSTSVVTTSSVLSIPISRRQRITQNHFVVWVDANFDATKQDYQDILIQLHKMVYDVRVFAELNEAIDFITDDEDMQVFLILTVTTDPDILTNLDNIQQIHSIYILCDNDSQSKGWKTQCKRFIGIHADIKSICQELQSVVKQHNQNAMPLSFVAMDELNSNKNLNQLEPSFMYTQIFKEILLEMKHDRKSIEAFILFWRQHYLNNSIILGIIDEFKRDYCPQSSIWWYTREYFIFGMLNQGLRTLDSHTIISMGFFIRDLHKQIEQLHQKQIDNYNGKVFTVYRGQGLSKLDFGKLLKSKSGLMSFNNFLSTSPKREVALLFAMSSLGETDIIGILFKITIDVSISSTPFAFIKDLSYYREEEEILFSMHTIFRIGEIIAIDANDTVYEVNLTLTEDDDEQLRDLTKRIREEVDDETGWRRLGLLLTKIRQVHKAEEVYNVLLEQTSDQSERALYFNNLGYIKTVQGDYQRALKYYEKSLEIRQKILPQNDPLLASSYNNIGGVYHHMGKYLEAASFYEKSLDIGKKALPPNHPNLASSYNNIAMLYHHTGDYSQALPLYKISLGIYEKTLPPNHPDLAQSYHNIGLAYKNMGEYSKALSFYEKSLDIEQKTLPSNHPHLAGSYNNVANVYKNMGEYSKALSFYETSLEIQQKTLAPNHPDMATSYNNIGLVYYGMQKYAKALSFHEKALKIRQETLSPNHPDLAQSYNNIAGVYHNIGDYSKALSFFNKSLEIRQETLSPNHPDLAQSYNNIAGVYHNMGDYPKALSLYEISLKIYEKSLPPNHHHLAISYNNIGLMYDKMGEYSKALSYLEHSLTISRNSLPSNHPNIKTVELSIDIVKKKL